MSSPARDARLKNLQTRPNAIVHRRGANSLTMFDPDSGTYIYDTQVSRGGWHYGQNNENEVDTDWVQNGPGWEMLKAAYTATLQGNTYSFAKGGQSVSITVTDAPQWVNEADQRETAAQLNVVNPTASGDVITYPGLLGAGADLTVETQTMRLAKRLTLPTLATLSTPSLSGMVSLALNFRMQRSAGVTIWINGVEWNENGNNPQLTSGAIEFRAGAETLFGFPVPFAIDANGVQVNGQMYARKTGANLFVEVRIPYAWLESAAYPVIIDPTIDEQVGAGNDDAFEAETGYGFDATGVAVAVVAAVNDYDRFWAGLRFQTIALDNAATINTGSYIELYHNTGIVLKYKVSGEDVDDAADFATTADVSGRTLTTAISDSHSSTGTINTWDQSAEIQTVLQEIVDRAGWATGQDMVLIARGDVHTSTLDGRAASYNSSTTLCPKLHIEYGAAVATLEVNISDPAARVQGVKVRDAA